MTTETKRTGPGVGEMAGMLSELESGLGAAEPANLQPDWLRAEIGRLEATLKRCFADETHSLLYEDLPMRQPRLARRIEALHREHVLLLDWARRLASTGAVEADPVLLATLTSELRALVERLRRHEAEESDLLQEAFDTDLGTVD